MTQTPTLLITVFEHKHRVHECCFIGYDAAKERADQLAADDSIACVLLIQARDGELQTVFKHVNRSTTP